MLELTSDLEGRFFFQIPELIKHLLSYSRRMAAENGTEVPMEEGH